MTKPVTRVIAMLSFDDAQILDIAGPLEVFSRASRWLQDHRVASPEPYRVMVVSKSGGQLRLSNGLRLAAEPLDALECVDTLLVAGGIGIDAAASDKALLAWVRSTAARAVRIAGVCTGSVLLGEAGLLRNRPATTHWGYFDRLQRADRTCAVNRSAIFVRSGNIITSAGVTAGMDMALALVEEDHGKAVAVQVAQELVMFLRRPGDQAQFSRHVKADLRDTPFAMLERWVLEHLDEDLSVATLASMAGCSERSFYRRLHSEIGCAPASWIRTLRVEAARRRLEHGARSLKDVARQCGFGSDLALRRAFRAEVGVTPMDYSLRFG